MTHPLLVSLKRMKGNIFRGKMKKFEDFTDSVLLLLKEVYIISFFLNLCLLSLSFGPSTLLALT